LLFDALKIENVAASHDSFQFDKRSQLFIRAHNEPISVIAVRISNPDCSPFESRAET
jgi:hypothetical protein